MERLIANLREESKPRPRCVSVRNNGGDVNFIPSMVVNVRSFQKN